VLDDFGDDIEEISGFDWTPNARLRPKREDATTLLHTVAALRSHFEAAKITESTPEPAETSPLQNDQDHQDRYITLDDSRELVQSGTSELPLALTHLSDQQADLPSSGSAEVPKESVVVARAVSEMVIALTPSLPQQLEQALDTVNVAHEGSIQDKNSLVVSASVPKEALAEVQRGFKRSVRNAQNPVMTYNIVILSGREIHTPTKYLDKHHKTVLHGSLAGIPKGDSYRTHANIKGRDTNSKRDGRRLQISEHWNEDTWRRFTSASVVPISTFISSLGPKTRHLNSGDVVDHPACNKLIEEVDQAAAELYANLTVDELIEAAADYTFLDEQIPVLLQKYAREIWSADVDRSQLLQAGAIEAYAKDLTYEDEEYRKTLHLHMHQWMFAKAFANLRMSGDTDEARAATLKTLKQQSVPVETSNPYLSSEKSRQRTYHPPTSHRQRRQSPTPHPSHKP
jgi:hypothetical protein